MNRQLSQDTPATIKLSGFEAGATAKVQVLSAGSINDENDPTKPEAIKPQESDVDTTTDQLKFVFPHASITRIELMRKAG